MRLHTPPTIQFSSSVPKSDLDKINTKIATLELQIKAINQEAHRCGERIAECISDYNITYSSIMKNYDIYYGVRLQLGELNRKLDKLEQSLQ